MPYDTGEAPLPLHFITARRSYSHNIYQIYNVVIGKQLLSARHARGKQGFIMAARILRRSRIKCVIVDTAQRKIEVVAAWRQRYYSLLSLEMGRMSSRVTSTPH